MFGTISALLVEDDARLARFTTDYLVDNDVVVTHVEDGDAALAEVARTRFDIILLDLMLPNLGGIAVCRRVRRISDVPIIVLTARVTEADRVLGLEVGADDYVVKPFSPRELLARIRSQVRRDRGSLASKMRPVQVGDLVLDHATRAASLHGAPLGLTSAEFDLLSVLVARPGRILSREQLMRFARGRDDEVFERAVDIQISRIRHKLSAHPGGESLICTVRGVGYMFGGAAC